MAADGRFLVAWDTDTYAVRAQRFDAAGRSAGPSFVVSGAGASQPVVAVNRVGETVVAWSGMSGVEARRYDAAGSPRSGAFTLPGLSDIDLDDAGTTWVAWERFTSEDPAIGTHDVYAQRFGPTGASSGAPFLVNVTTRGSQFGSSVAVDGSGTATIAWQSNHGDGIYTDVYARRFTSDGGTTSPPPNGSASIAGTLFDDADADGARDVGEAALANWRVFVDADKDGVFDSTEKSVLTDASGNYKFAGLSAATYRVREVLQSGWRRTAPAAGYHDVSLTSGQAVTGKSFANTRRVLISGTSFSDTDGDGVRDAGEAALASRRVFLDADADGVFDSTERSTLTDAAGSYRFDNLPAGTHRVREILPGGWRRTAPSSGVHTVALGSGQTTTSRHFGSTQRVLISGAVFNDANGDRVRQSTETGLAGWRVFLDADRDGVLDSTERSTLTDAAGRYRFGDLPAGSYSVRVVQQGGWSRTTPTGGSYLISLSSGQASTDRLFGQRRIG